MSTSTDGQICFGIKFEDEHEFPWGGEELDEWWREVNGCSIECPNEDDSGDVWGDYFDARNKWDKENLIPVAEVNYQSGDCPAYILAVPSSVQTALRGDPTEFDPEELITTTDEFIAFVEFFRRFGTEVPYPSWYLSSYWG